MDAGVNVCGQRWTGRRSTPGVILAAMFLVSGVAVSQEVLIPVGAEWKFFRGMEEPSPDVDGLPTTAWTEVGFADGDWEDGMSGFGYEATPGSDPAHEQLLGTVLDDMQNLYLSVYVRKEFDIEDLRRAPVVQLGIMFDDSYIAYVNGVEISRTSGFGTPGTPVAFNSTTAPSNEAAAAPAWINFPAAAMDALVEGTNVLALHGHNTNLTSSDMYLIPQLRVFTTFCPQNATCQERSNGSVLVRWTNPTGVTYDAVEIARNGELIGMPSTPRSVVFSDPNPLPGLNFYQVIATLNGEQCSGDDVASCSITIGGIPFKRGDADGDGAMLLTDGVFILNALFRGNQFPQPACPDAADADDDSFVLLTDAIFVLQRLFRGGNPPPAPGPTACGDDPTQDALGDCVYNGC